MMIRYTIYVLLLMNSNFVLAKDVPTQFSELVKKTGIQEGEYLPVDSKSKKCESLDLRFVFPENNSVSILDGAKILFENVGANTSNVDRDCKRTVESSVENNKITQKVIMKCKKEEYSLSTSSELSSGKLLLKKKFLKNDKITESSSCQYTFAKKIK